VGNSGGKSYEHGCVVLFGKLEGELGELLTFGGIRRLKHSDL
jgi:hypothetical protein